METLTDLLKEPSDEPKGRCVVRLRTTAWEDGRGAHLKKSVTFLKKQSAGHNFLQEDISCIGAELALTRIVNLYECQDGVYEVTACNISHDYETGYADDWDYKLIAIKP